jgi:predicted AAA+ superfamily ATPase
VLANLTRELPAVMVVGPRAAGKTTSARRLARTVVRLDREAEAAAYHADPDAVLRTLAEPVLLDEWQAAPEVLGAVKRAVDDDPRPGRFILTGSVRADLEAQTWPGTGRVVRVSMYGLTRREVDGDATAPTIFDRLVDDGVAGLRLPAKAPDLRDYIDLALAGAFPESVLRLSGAVRTRWLDSYLDQLLTRDAGRVGDRDPLRLRRYFEAVALNTAGIVDDRTLFEAAGVSAKTAASYSSLLANLFVVDALPAWATNRLKRLVRGPKRYIVDAALAASALRVDTDGVLSNGDLMGRILDTFVVSQLRAEVEVSELRPRLYHARAEQGRHEIDILVELSGHRVIAIEVKADAAPAPAAARHLEWLRDQLGDRFLLGLVLHTGPRGYELSERVAAVPICALWS